MAIVPTQTSRILHRHAVTLEEYARYIEYSECAFFGVMPPDFQQLQNTCRQIWTLDQRNYIARYLAEAQEEIENQVGYLLQPTFVVGRVEDEPHRRERYVDEQVPRRGKFGRYGVGRGYGIYNTRWNKLIAPGVKLTTVLASGAAINQATDPATVGPIALPSGVTDVNEIHLFYPGEDLEIHPSAMTISGGNLTIEVPRCRTVLFSLLNNPDTGYDYNDLSNFLTTIDVKRITASSSTEAVLRTSTDCSNCSTEANNGCLRVYSHQMGTVGVELDSQCVPCTCQTIELNYYCGEITLPQQAREVIIRLAHTKMPDEPCGCEVAQRLWEADREIPTVMTRERANNPFGLMDGAWIAWKWTQTLKHYRMGSL